MKKAIVFCGQICSGKTTLADYYCKRYQWDKISFGQYIKNIAEERQVSINRHNLQKIGYKMYKTNDPRDFLIQTIRFNKPTHDIHAHESIRHLTILFEVQKYYEDTITFFIEVSDCILYERYVKKYNEDITYPQFKKIINHPIEKEILNMKEKSNYILDGSIKLSNLIDIINSILNENGYKI